MKCAALVIAVASLLLQGCASTPAVRVTRYTAETFPPSTDVKVLRMPPPDRDYVELGEVSIRLRKLTEETAVSMLCTKAAELGADAIILLGERHKGSVLAPVGDMYVAVPIRELSAVAIRYKERQLEK
jgi:hypothetical protein